MTPVARRARFISAGYWTADTLAQRVTAHARAQGDALALVDCAAERTHSWADLDRDVNRLAQYLLGVGVRPGDVVSVQLPNWYETVVVGLAVMTVGAVMNPLLTNYRRKELADMLNVGGVEVLFTPATYRGFDHAALGQQLRAEVPSLKHHVTVADPGLDGSFADWLAGFTDLAPAVPADAAAVSQLIFTSGTEARPKAIMHTEQTTNFGARAVASSLGLTPSDVVWMPSPIGHSTGFNFGVRVALYNGLPLVLQDRWSADDAMSLIERFRCSYTIAATTFASDIIDAARGRTCDLSSMRLFGSGGSPIPQAVVTAADALGMRLLRLYGSTETQMVTTNRPDSPVEKLTATDGLALDGVEVEVRSEEDRAVLGEPGEIVVRGPNTCVGFYADPERTAATCQPDGWVRSGDLGVLDAEGYLTIVGRKKEIIIRGGLNIAPREIEDVIVLHPGVAEVAVVGLPHPRLGEITCACVVAREGAEVDLASVVDLLERRGMATYKLPQRLVLLDELPRTPSGKVRKFEIVEQLTAHAATAS